MLTMAALVSGAAGSPPPPPPPPTPPPPPPPEVGNHFLFPSPMQPLSAGNDSNSSATVAILVDLNTRCRRIVDPSVGDQVSVVARHSTRVRAGRNARRARARALVAVNGARPACA